jgi:hypothetical protein
VNNFFLGRDAECEKKGYVSIAINGYTLGHKYLTPSSLFHRERAIVEGRGDQRRRVRAASMNLWDKVPAKGVANNRHNVGGSCNRGGGEE